MSSSTTVEIIDKKSKNSKNRVKSKDMKYECITCKLAYKFQIFKSKSSLKKRFTDRQYIKSGGQADIYQSYDELK